MRLTRLVNAILIAGLLGTLFPFAGFAQDEGWGHLKGRIVVAGEVPDPAELPVDKDAAVCLAGDEKIFDTSLRVGDDGGLQDAFVMMYFGRNDPTPKIHPSYEKTANDKVVLDNHNCRFDPPALFLRTGQTLTMKNSDEVGHNCHVSLFKNEINANIPAFDSVDAQLTQAEKVPGPVKCDIHKWMSAVILVRDEPYAALTDKDGNFLIENIPAGEWTFQFWHQRSGYMRDLQKEGEKFLGRRGELKIKIESGETVDLGELVMPVESLVAD